MDSCVSTILLIFISTLHAAEGYGTGAGTSICRSDTLIPGHRLLAQTSPSPYSFTVDTENINAGGTVTVTVSGSGFAGFYVAGQDSADDSFIGYFDDPSTEAVYKIGPCTDSITGNNAGATHKNQNTKGNVVLTWNSPPSFSGTVCFRGAVANAFSTFWGPLTSPCVTVSTPITTSLTTTATTEPITAAGETAISTAPQSQPTATSTVPTVPTVGPTVSTVRDPETTTNGATTGSSTILTLLIILHVCINIIPIW